MKSWPYLWCYQVSKEKGKSKEQYSDAVPCHVLSCVLRSDLDSEWRHAVTQGGESDNFRKSLEYWQRPK